MLGQKYHSFHTSVYQLHRCPLLTYWNNCYSNWDSVRPNQEFYRTTEPNRTTKKNTEPNRTVPNRRPNQYWTKKLTLLKNVIFSACFLVCEDHFSSYKYKTWHSFLQKQHFEKFQFSLKNFLHLISQFMLLFLLFPLLGSVSGCTTEPDQTSGSAELTEPNRTFGLTLE